MAGAYTPYHDGCENIPDATAILSDPLGTDRLGSLRLLAQGFHTPREAGRAFAFRDAS